MVIAPVSELQVLTELIWTHVTGWRAIGRNKSSSEIVLHLLSPPRQHPQQRIVLENKIMNQCCGRVKDRNDHESMGRDFVYLCDVMRKGAIS